MNKVVKSYVIKSPIIALTIAGSDSSAGAGMQADLRVFNHLGLYGVCAVTAVTSQNTMQVAEVVPVESDKLNSQLEAILADSAPAATKTGMLVTVNNLNVVVEYAAAGKLGLLVVDPVLDATMGRSLAEEGLAGRIANDLVPNCQLVTPNHEEARALTGIEIVTQEHAARAATVLIEMGAGAACVTGGHFPGDAIDVLHDGRALYYLKNRRLGHGDSFHGTGCLFSAAAAGYLALGNDMRAAVSAAKKLTTRFIASAVSPGHGMMVPWPPA